MTIHYVSGLDWSGDPNRQADMLPGFAVAIASTQREEISAIEERLNACRQSLGYRPGYMFHYKESDSRTRESFFAAMQGLPVSVVIHYSDRRHWSPSYLSSTTGPERIRQAIGDAVNAMNVQHIEHGILMVDQRRDEKNFVGHLRRDLRAVTKQMESRICQDCSKTGRS